MQGFFYGCYSKIIGYFYKYKNYKYEQLRIYTKRRQEKI